MDALETIRAHVASIIESDESREVKVAQKARAKEEEGYRIVNGGQVHGDAWDVHDWRTDEVIAEGTGREAMGALYLSERWWDIDVLGDDVPFDDPDPEPSDILPASLADALTMWASGHFIDAEMWLEATATH